MTCINQQFCTDKHGDICKRRAKLRPRQGALRIKAKHWALMEDLRLPDSDSRLPHWAFDFIGIHHLSFTDCYSLSAPLLLVCDKTGKRPLFENELFDTKLDALRRAKQLCKEHRIPLFIVDCLD